MIQMTDQLLSEFESLRFFYEEKSIYFVDGYDLVLLLLIKFFETASPRFTEDTPMPGIYKEYKEKNEDLDFVKVLFRKTILGDDESTEIPLKVTLNEYIELAKYFSTANSKVFVNGVLDKLIGEFKSEGKINKSGRGLKE